MNHSPLSTFTPHRTCRITAQYSPRYIDCYDRAVAILTRHPRLIRRAWSLPDPRPGTPNLPPVTRLEKKLTDYCHCLFAPVCSDRQGGGWYGCLTQIRGNSLSIGEGDTLTEIIRVDTRLPDEADDIIVDHLPMLAGWQRRIDIVLNRTPLPMRVGG